MAGRLQLPLHQTRRSLWFQTLLWIGGMTLAFLIVVYVLSQIILLEGFRDLEVQTSQQDALRTQHMLLAELNALKVTGVDWAFWDDTYTFVQTGNPAYIDSNLMDTTFDSLSLNVFLFHNTAGELIFGKAYDLVARNEIPLPAGVTDLLCSDPRTARLTSETDSTSGFVMLPDGPMYIVAYPILTSEHTGPVAGTLTMGRYVTERLLSQLNDVSIGQVSLGVFADPALPDSVRDALRTAPGPIIEPVDAQTAVSYTRIDDIHDQPALVLSIEAPRTIYRQGHETIQYFLLIVVLGSVGALVVMTVWVQRGVLKRLTRISSTVREIGQSGDLDVRVMSHGQSAELSGLAESINEMLNALSETHRAQTQQIDAHTQKVISERDMLRILIDNLPERLYVKDRQGRFVVANAAVAQHYGLPRVKDIIGKTDFDLRAPDDAQRLFEQEQALLRGDIETVNFEIYNRPHESYPGWHWVRKLPLRNPQGRIVGLVGIGRNITDRKEMEEALRAARDELEQRVEERTAELSLANMQLKLEVTEREQAQMALADSERTARAFQEKLKVLHEVSLELSQITELDVLYERAIELGLRRLGFERLGLWRLSDDGQDMLGTFGIDTDGVLRDERHLRSPVVDDPYVYQLLQQRSHLMVWNDKELLDQWHSVGRGWGAMAALWDGSRTIGWLATDNLLTLAPPPLYQSELLRLYGSALGHTIAHLEIEAELRQSELRHSSLFNGVPATLYRTNPDGDLLAANPALIDLLGYADWDSLQQVSVNRFYVNLADRERWREAIERESTVHNFEMQIRRGDGSVIWVQDTAHVVRWPDGSVRYYEGSLIDVTARKQAQAHLAQAMERLHSHAHELATVAEVSRQVTTILDIDRLLWTVCDLTQTNFGLYYAQIYLLDDAGENLVLAAGAGETGRLLVAHRHSIPASGALRSLVARAASHREPVVINDVTQSLDFLPNVLLPKTRSEIAVPMLVGDQLIGVLDVQADVFDRFSERDVSIITTLAAQVAIAIHNARLFTENARRLALIENSTDLIALADMETLKPLYINPAGLKLVGLKDFDEVAARPVQSFYPRETLLEMGRTILPTVQREGVWRGESMLKRADGSRIPTEQTILAIGDDGDKPHTVATIITDITQRKRDEEALRRANRAYHTLSDCNQALVRATDEVGLLNEICRIIVETGGYPLAWVGYTNPDQPEMIRPVASAGDATGFIDAIFALERDFREHPGPLIQAIQQDSPVIINDLGNDPDYALFRSIALAHGHRALIALPLGFAGYTTGALAVYAAQPHAFDDQELALLTELASDLTYGLTVLRTRIERQQALDQLREHEANLSAILENTDAAIWSVDRALDLVAFNTGYRQFFGLFYADELKPGFPVDALPNDRAVFWRGLYERALTGERFRTEIHYDWEGIPSFDMEMAFNPIESSAGIISGVTVFGRDITARKRYLAQLERLNDELLALHDIGRTLTATLDVRAIYRLLFEEVAQKRFGALTFFVALYDETEQMIVCDFAVMDGDESDVSLLPSMPLGSGPNSETIRTGQPRIIQLPADDTEPPLGGQYVYVGDHSKPRPRSSLYVPLISQNTVIGVINVQHYEADAFQTADMQLLSTLANQAATAIQNAHLFEAEHRQRIYAETLRDIAAAVNNTLDLDRVMDNIFENIQRVIPHDAANIMIIESGRARVVGSSVHDDLALDSWLHSVIFDVEGNDLLRRVRDSGETLIVPDTTHEPGWELFPETDWQRAYACAPILRENTLIGFLNLYSAQLDAFTPQHAAYLHAFAIQAGNAIRNAQLFAATQQHAITYQQQANRLALINRVSARIAQAITLSEIYEILTHELQAAFGASFAGLVIYDSEVGQLVMDTHPAADEHRHRLIPYSNNPAVDYMRETHRVLVSADVVNDPLFEPVWDTLRARGTQSLMVVPLVVGGTVIGTLGLDSTTPRHFTEAECEIAETIVNQAAVAITKARLLLSERDQRIFAETLRDTAEAINRTLDLDKVLDRILDNIQRVIPHDAANIAFIDDEWIYVVRATGYEQFGLSDSVGTMRAKLSETINWKAVVTTGKPLAIPDTRDAPGWLQLVKLNTWVRSTVKAPIWVDDKVIGVLSLDGATPGSFTAEHAERLQAFAFQAASAIRNAQLFASERDQRQFAETLRDTAEAVNRTLDPDKVLDRILDNIRRVIPHDAANIMFVQEDQAYVVRATGYEQFDSALDIHQLSLPLDYAGAEWRRLIDDRHPTIIADMRAPEWVQMLKINTWLRSTVKAPIQIDNQLIGILNLDSATPHAFDENHAERLQAFAVQAANAIRNAQLFASERDQRLLAEALRDTAKVINSTLDFDAVLDNILTTIGRVVPHDAANIMLIEDGIARIARGFGYEKYGADEWVRAFEFHVDETHVWQSMLQTGQPFAIPVTKTHPDWPNIPEEVWIESTVKAPIQIEGKIIGILHLDSTTPGAFTQSHAERLQPFADQAAIAIRNAQLFAAEHRQRTMAEALRDTANEMAGSVNLADAAQRILESVGRVVPHDAANIMVFDWETGIAHTIASRGYMAQGRGSEKNGQDVPISKFLHPAIEHSLIIPDTHNNEDWFMLPGDEWIRSYVSAPIRLQDEVIGMINLDCKTPDYYTDQHVERLKVFANQAAIVIERAQLFEAVQRHADELELRVAIRTEQLSQQRRQLQAILDAMSEGVLYDAESDVQYINPALTRLTGYRQEEFVDYLSVLRSTQQPEQDFALMIENLLDKVQRRGIWQQEARLRRKDGSEFDASLTVTPVRNTDERMIGAVTVLRDISQEKALQEQKDRFIANASHELRTPLANIKTRLYLLNHQPEKMAQHLAIINRVSNNMAELVENLLDVSRFDRGVIMLNRRATVLQALVEEVASIQQAEAEQKEVTFHVSLHPTPLQVQVDPQRMTQVITNLVANAINYTEPGGSVLVELTTEAGESGSWAVLHVIDTGIGITRELVEHVFEPFFRADERVVVGTGLGLTIAYDIVRLHGGTITVDSTLGEGSTFTVRLALDE